MFCRDRKVAASLAPASSNPFLIATSLDSIKPDATSRKFIRRHVTKGKKVKRRAPRRHTPKSWLADEDQHYDGSPVVSRHRELALDLVEPRILHVLQYLVPIMVKVMYTTDQCVDLAIDNQNWHDDLARDPPYAESVSAIFRVYFDIVRSRDPKIQRRVHMSHFLSLIRKQLAGPALVVSDSLLFKVVLLALWSENIDELEDAITHLRGLRAMINLRGGIVALAHKRSLQIKCCRVDLLIAMRTGLNPLLLTHDDLTWKPYLADAPSDCLQRDVTWKPLVDAPDVRLVNVWRDLRDFAMSMNLAHQTKRKISPVLFQEVLLSVQYRLHHLEFNSADLQETLRLAMLAFSASLFLDVHSKSERCDKVACAFGESLRCFDTKGDGRRLRLQLWLILIFRLTLAGPLGKHPRPGREIGEVIEELRLTSWNEVRQVLKEFLWVDILHDKGGEQLYNTANSVDVVHLSQSITT